MQKRLSLNLPLKCPCARWSAALENRRNSPGRFAHHFATYHPKARLLNRIDEALLLHELRIVEHTSLPIIERHGCHPYAGLLFNEALDCICARAAEGRKCGQLFSVGGQCTFRSKAR